MQRAFKIILGIILYIIGCMLALTVLFSETNIFKHALNLIKGPKLDYGPYEYGYSSAGVVLNCVILIIVYFAFKKGKQLIKSKRNNVGEQLNNLQQ